MSLGDERLTEEQKHSMNARIDLAFDFVTANLTNNIGTLGDDTEALHRKVVKALASAMRVRPGDSTWEIGCGCPKLAFSLSAAACSGMVIATDLCMNVLMLDTNYSTECCL